MNQPGRPASDASPPTDDPFAVLGLPPGSDEASVRARYLELVKRYPPERDPVRFRAIHAAYQAARDPLAIATQLVSPPPDAAPRPWKEIIDRHRERPPRLQPDLLLSLGNRAAETTGPGKSAGPGKPPQPR